jgi:hypothetical protein
LKREPSTTSTPTRIWKPRDIEGIIRAKAGEGNNGAAISRLQHRLTEVAHRKNGEGVKFSKKTIAEVRSGSYRHRRPIGSFDTFKRPAKTAGKNAGQEIEKSQR